MSGKGLIEKVPHETLFVSTPNPFMFGNESNVPEGKLEEKGWTAPNWLTSRFHFSFAEYRDQDRMGFGALRVTNDDLVQPNRGFGEHPHQNVEIVTYVVSGELSHKDSDANAETLTRGEVQYMSAGRGVYHSESNNNKTAPCRFIQMWINTRTMNQTPIYGSRRSGDAAARTNQWEHLVTDRNNGLKETAIKINQDVNIYVAEMHAGKQLDLELLPQRMVYCICIEGQVEARLGSCKENLVRHDAAKFFGSEHIQAINFLAMASESGGEAHVLVVEMAK